MLSIKELINKGVPITTQVTVFSSELIENSNNKEATRIKIRREFEKYLRGLLKYGYDDFDVLMTFSILSDYDTLEKKLSFAGVGFVSSLILNLNIDNICKNINNRGYDMQYDIYEYMEQNREKIYNQIQKLSNITNERKLKKAFPILYKKYMKQKDYYGKIRFLFQKYNSSSLMAKNDLYRKIAFEYGLDLNNLFEEMKNARDFSVDSFCRKKALVFSRVVSNYQEILDYSRNTSIDIDEIDIDKEKLELIFVYSFLRMIKGANKNDKQRFIYYIQNYFDTNPDMKSNTSIQMVTNIGNTQLLDNGALKEKTVTPKDVYDEYQKVLINNPSIELMCLNNIDFNEMNLGEVEEFVAEYLKNFSANWELIPENNANNSDVLDLEIAREVNGLTDSQKQSDLDRRIELFMEKKNFYASLDPFYRVIGQNTFKGYVGFIYPNGKVVLDKFYKGLNSRQVSDGDAIYIMDIADFYRLSHFGKRVLMKDSRVTRIVHKGNWKERVLEEIDGDCSRKTSMEAQQLIKRGCINGNL